jgi:hypothetical protein
MENFEKVLQANIRITTCQETYRHYQPFLACLNSVSFFAIFLKSNELKVQFTGRHSGEVLIQHNDHLKIQVCQQTSTAVHFPACVVAFATIAELFSFSLKRNVYKCTKSLPAARHRSDSRSKLETPWCNACRILLRHEARDKSSDRNSVSCQSLVTLWRYDTW